MSSTADSARPRSLLPNPLRVRRMRWLILIVLLGLYFSMQAPLEVGRWKLAAAMQSRAAGDKERAYAELAGAMNWIPNSPQLYLQRAEWHLADGQRDEALAENDKMLELAGE